jgi:hypothetical protein
MAGCPTPASYREQANMTEQKPETASIYYEDRPGKPTLVATGAFGGATPDGQHVVAHLYVEYGTVPSVAELEHKGDGVYEQTREIKRGYARREIQATLVLTPTAAASIGQWLGKHAHATLNREGG